MSHTLTQLVRLAERWRKANVKSEDRRTKALDGIAKAVAARQNTAHARRCALPKKQQRRLGIAPPILPAGLAAAVAHDNRPLLTLPDAIAHHREHLPPQALTYQPGRLLDVGIDWPFPIVQRCDGPPPARPIQHGIKLLWGFYGEAPLLPEGWMLSRSPNALAVVTDDAGREFVVGTEPPYTLYPWLPYPPGHLRAGERYMDTEHPQPMPPVTRVIQTESATIVVGDLNARIRITNED